MTILEEVYWVVASLCYIFMLGHGIGELVGLMGTRLGVSMTTSMIAITVAMLGAHALAIWLGDRI